MFSQGFFPCSVPWEQGTQKVGDAGRWAPKGPCPSVSVMLQSRWVETSPEPLT